jgi:uncharacterized alkaline shock family protein YloU
MTESAASNAAPSTASTPTSSSSPSSTGGEGRSRSSSVARRSELTTEHGKTAIADSVVAKIAGLACREIDGGLSRTLGVLKDKLPVGGSQPSAARGVHVEVGERQAAIDLDVVVVYGASIVDVANAVRENVIGRVEAMTGLEVTEVNVTVDDVYLGELEEPSEPRVQ